MITDALELANASAIETDVCIVGAGPAGITIARELSRESFRVCLVESGGLGYEPRTEELQRLSTIDSDLDPPQQARRRQFGGAANSWNVLTTPAGGGVRYLPLSDIDFEKREWVPYSGWPFSKADIDPFYERAQRVCDIGPFTYRVADWMRQDARKWPLAEEIIGTSIEQFGHARIFTHDYLAALRERENVNLLLHATATEIEKRPGSSGVESVAVSCTNGCRHRVKAAVFVLAMGGIENARLLLLSNAQQSSGLGNQHDLVGRFFMDHHNVFSGELVPATPQLLTSSALYDLRQVDQTWVMGKLSISERLMRRERLLHSAARIEARLDSKLDAALASIVAAARSARRGRLPDKLVSKMRDIVPEIPRLARMGTVALKERGLRGLAPRENHGRYRWSTRSGKWQGFASFNVELQIELAPSPGNRVMLGEERDPFGRRLAGVRWKWSEPDRRSARRAQEILAAALADSNLGVLHLPDSDTVSNVTSPAGAYHHIGTTRMHSDPKQGVVDADCRVHGLENLFVAGSSVFPTGGYANPTLTIVALSIRLADRIKSLMQARPANLS